MSRLTAPDAASNEVLSETLHFLLFLLWLKDRHPGVASQKAPHWLTVGTFGKDLILFPLLALVFPNGPRYANKAQSRTVVVVLVVTVSVVVEIVAVTVVVVHSSAAK